MQSRSAKPCATSLPPPRSALTPIPAAWSWPSPSSAEINQGVARLTDDQETAASREERYEAQGAGDQA